jgi:hypothetical protein
LPQRSGARAGAALGTGVFNPDANLTRAFALDQWTTLVRLPNAAAELAADMYGEATAAAVRTS